MEMRCFNKLFHRIAYRREIERVASAGGRLVSSGVVKHLVFGEVEELWDEVMAVEFPSKESFV